MFVFMIYIFIELYEKLLYYFFMIRFNLCVFYVILFKNSFLFFKKVYNSVVYYF